RGFFLVGIHAPLTHVMPEHKISDTPAALDLIGTAKLKTCTHTQSSKILTTIVFHHQPKRA
ncbi:MAG: hypothetical protein ACN6PW_14670, partial [Pseudomonas kermanshahensis]|uniref:hypothetical protein n=1 Tax=Pseudomonas kermanshahensis TaxID=2745482 RepID=UPI003D0F0706